MKVKPHFEDVDQLTTKVKSAIVKNKPRQVKFATIGCPSWPVDTRWGSWLNAASYYAKYLPEVKAIVESFEVKVSLQTTGLANYFSKSKTNMSV